MSLKATEQALANLLPALAEALPDELVKLAAYLLVQSRSHGGSLKPEEEIARPYACAEIAYKRLCKSLALPPAISRPPCPPRIYRKLYTYLDQVLSKSALGPKRQENTDSLVRTTRAATRNKNLGAPITPQKTTAKTSRSLPTPSKRPLENTKTTRLKAYRKIQDTPSWAIPLVRRICNGLVLPMSKLAPTIPSDAFSTFTPHIFAGIPMVLRFAAIEVDDPETDLGSEELGLCTLVSNPESKDAKYHEAIITLAIALYLIVARRRLAISDDSNNTDCLQFGADTLSGLIRTALLTVDMDSRTLPPWVDLWIKLIFMRGWIDGWYENIQTYGDEAVHEEMGEDSEDEDHDIISPKKRKLMNRYTAKLRNNVSQNTDEQRLRLLPGLGTMMHDRVDWLSEDRRAESARWREGIMKWIREIKTDTAN
ncbi:hypothetical protein LOZ66_005645 [Ophidiomyces ophidiicola]|nr:hypothetical protein LOZ66_005645 [Ophidiomyces ophidiicola]